MGGRTRSRSMGRQGWWRVVVLMAVAVVSVAMAGPAFALPPGGGGGGGGGGTPDCDVDDPSAVGVRGHVAVGGSGGVGGADLDGVGVGDVCAAAGGWYVCGGDDHPG